MEPLRRVLGIHFENSAVAHYRIWLPFRTLNEELGMECWHYPEQGYLGTISLSKLRGKEGALASLEERGSWAQMVVFQRISTLLNLSVAVGLRDSCGIPLVAEADDDLFSVPPSNFAYSVYQPTDPAAEVKLRYITAEEAEAYKDQPGVVVQKEGDRLLAAFDTGGNARKWTEVFLREADAITTTTERLREVFSEYNPYVYVLPNSIDVNRWESASCTAPAVPKVAGEVRIGWLGGAQHYDDLKVIKDVVSSALTRHPGATFHMTSLLPEFWGQWQGNPRFIHHRGCPIQTWPETLASLDLDIALAPLNSCRFNRAKSNLKLLEYGALGIPTIFSRMDPYGEVQHGVTGMVADSDGEWHDSLDELIENADKRRAVGEAARRFVFERYDIRKTVGEWRKAYEEVYSRSGAMRRRQRERLARKAMGRNV